jgi:hypothetical protein
LKKNEFPIFNLLGLLGSALWAMTIFLREAEMALSGSVRFLMGIAPNFAVGLLIPALLVIGYPSLFKKDLALRTFVLLLLGSYTLIFTSEVIHDVFLGSRFDPLDMAASLVGFIIMVAAFRAKKTAMA